jgi:hypothetical protein
MNVPGAQGVQLALEVAPGVVLYEPAGQRLQAMVPGAPQEPNPQQMLAPLPLLSPAGQVAQTGEPVEEAYVPAAHWVQVPAPPALEVPAGQALQEVEPLRLKAPAEQGRQSVAEVDAETTENLPASQAVHAWASAAAYVPAAQLKHADAPSTLNRPAAHDRQAAMDELPALGLNVPAPVWVGFVRRQKRWEVGCVSAWFRVRRAELCAGCAPNLPQGLHAIRLSLPSLGLYLPAAQLVQEDKPGLSLYEPAVQFRHASGATAFETGLYLPAPQSVQFDAPPVLNFPEEHDRHAAAVKLPVLGLNVPASQRRHAAMEVPFGPEL